MHASVWRMPVEELQAAVAAPRPAPAGVTTAAVSAVLGLSLVVKVLRIRGVRPELLAAALELIAELRAGADADIAAVQEFIDTRNQGPLRESPKRVAQAVARARQLCAQAAPELSGRIAADVTAAQALLEGAAAAVEACIAANIQYD
jgi:formiminotetrahydrofolate cyclodeaminase